MSPIWKEVPPVQHATAEMLANVKALEATVQKQTEELNDLENHSRRDNLVIFGYPEHNKEDKEILKQKMKGIFEDRL